MKSKHIKITVIVLITIAIGACKKIQNGFLSDTVRYKDRVIFCKRGMTLTLSDRINADGSTPPFTFKMLNLRNKETGAPAPEEFNKKYEIIVFKAGQTYNAATDTTLALLNAKRETVTKIPMEFNPVSGQLAFNRGSASLPLGKYEFDLEVTNPAGTKFYPSFAEIDVVDPSPEDVFTITYQAASGFNDAQVSTATKAPVITCTKISNQGARVILKIADKNGLAFNPKSGEVITRGDRPTFESYAKFNPIIATDTALICDFEVAPFPLANYISGTTDYGFLMYYRIPKQFVSIDGLPEHSSNPAFGFRVLTEGTYVVQIKLTDVTRITGR